MLTTCRLVVVNVYVYFVVTRTDFLVLYIYIYIYIYIYTSKSYNWLRSDCLTQNMCTITNFLYLILSTGPENGFNPLNAELNPICHLLALLGAHLILHVSRIRVK